MTFLSGRLLTGWRKPDEGIEGGGLAGGGGKAGRRHNLTQEVVRFDTGLNVGRIEAGCSDITLSTLADLCDYYDISPGELFQDIVTHSS